MGSYRDTNLMNQAIAIDLQEPIPGGLSDLFDKYLSKKMAESDLISYWLIRDIYQHYLEALSKSRTEIV